MSDKKEPPENRMLGLGLGLGGAFGIVLGMLLDNIALGVAIGPSLGLALAIGADQLRKRTAEDPADENNSS
ncbi:hypothetical protein [Arthrobacter castelli]|uniref:hypothetical protein n=1 Tax=Arthrobacter castelli TaxID=271431 RepID=UPI00042A30B8|nr:hypothetical protein [Arthrobacter castelli]